MKISKYTFLFNEENKEFYLYSSLSNALVEMDENSYSTLLRAQKEGSIIDATTVGQELYDLLVMKKFITENDEDSFLFYKSIVMAQRAAQDNMHLTLAPTMDCCFNCHYCFEKYKRHNYMSESVMDSIINFLNTLKNKPELRLTWFGGEPLMALSQIEQFYDKLITGYKAPNVSDIITTGFHIDAEAIRVMQKVGIKTIQITLDGNRDTHNKIKQTAGCDDVFSRVLDNVELLMSTTDIHVVFRVNITKINANEYVDLYNLLVDRFKKYEHLGIGIGFIMDRGDCDVAKNNIQTFFKPSEGAQFVLDLINKHNITSQFTKYPSRFFDECAIRNVMSASFDPEGYAYKCWEIIGNKKYAFGQLDKDGRMININDITLNRHLHGADPLRSHLFKMQLSSDLQWWMSNTASSK